MDGHNLVMGQQRAAVRRGPKQAARRQRSRQDELFPQVPGQARERPAWREQAGPVFQLSSDCTSVALHAGKRAILETAVNQDLRIHRGSAIHGDLCVGTARLAEHTHQSEA